MEVSIDKPAIIQNYIFKKDIQTYSFPVQAPPVKIENSSSVWNYNSFISNVTNKNIKRIKITHDQKYVELFTYNNEYHKMILPAGYDYINYLMYNDIEIEIVDDFIHRINLFDIISAIFQLLVIKLVFQFVNKQNKSKNNKKQIIEKPPDNKIIAYREAGQALMSIFMNKKVDKLSIVNTDPNKKNFSNALNVYLGGKIAEEIIFGIIQTTSGLSAEFQIASNIVTNYRYYDKFTSSIDDHYDKEELKKIIKVCYRKTRIILKRNEKYLHILANDLIKYKTLEREDILKAIAGLSCNISLFQNFNNKT